MYFRKVEILKKIGKSWETKIAYSEQYSSNELDNKWDENYRLRLRKFASDKFSHYIETDDFEENGNEILKGKKINPEKCTDIKLFCSKGQEYNSMLRKNQENDFLRNVEEYISKCPLKKDIIVYRGLDENILQNNIESANNFKDVDLYDKGFLFTSLTRGGIANYNCKLRIFLPSGTCAIYTGNVNGEEQRYQEVVVQRGAKLKIVSKDKDFYNCKLILP